MATKSIYENKHWKEFRKSLLEDKDCTCYLCGKKKWKFLSRKKVWKSVGRFEIHHLHYNTVGHETEEDTRVLCHSCHQLITEIEHRRPDSSFIQELQSICTNYIERK